MTTPPATFDATFDSVAEVEGWMTEGQARRLWDRARSLGADDQIVEIGSYHGRSLIMLATAAAPGVSIVSIDPHAGNDTAPTVIEGSIDEGARDHDRYRENLERAGVWDRVNHLRRPSQEATDEVDRSIELLYIDGAHRYEPARDDIRDWSAKVAADGVMLIHDCFSSVGVTRAQIALLFFSGEFEYVGRSTSMAEYRRRPLRGLARARNAVRQIIQLPWFALNLVKKVLIYTKLRPVDTIPY